jgi:hypothetical protein
MTKVTLDKSTWTQINSAAARIQIFGGRVLVADSNAPTADDFHVWPPGEIIDITANKFAQIHPGDSLGTYIVRLAV